MTGTTAIDIVASVLLLLAGLIHVGIWLLESVLWRGRKTWRSFGIRSEEEAETIRFWALNQGWYNLFLAAGALIGAAAPLLPADAGARLGFAFVGAFAALVMLGAAIVLVISTRGRLWRAALLQGLIPLLAVVFAALGLLGIG